MKEIKNYYPSGQIHQHYWVDEKGNHQGEFKYWYDNGQLSYHRFYKNGLKNGECKSWYKNGQLAHHCFYKDNLKEGECKIWYSSGQLNEHCFYKNGLREGEYKEWRFTGQLKEHCFFHNDNVADITEYATDKNNIAEKEYFHLQLVFGYFPIFKYGA